MQVKTFKAVDMPEALRMVKDEFGPDAMILSSRKQRRKGFLSRFSKQYIEVTAGLDPTPRAKAELKPERELSEPNTLDAFQRSMLAPMARELKELRALVQTLSAKEKTPPRREPESPRTDDTAGRRQMSAPPARQMASQPDRERFVQELPTRVLPNSEVEELKRVLLRSFDKQPAAVQEKIVSQQKAAPARTTAPEVDTLTRELRANGVDDELVTQLLAPVKVAAARGESLDRLRARLSKTVADGVSCSGSFKLKKNASRILALVGPTGVGKTTTIAKLAALAYKQGVSVALITIDTFRIGAVAQLQTYSGIMNLPMEIAATPAELAEAIDAHADKQLVFIDTAGRNPRDRTRIQEMKAFLDVHPDIETHLCLSATTRDKELSQAVSRFGVLPISRLLFTKLDESMSFGCIVNTHLRNKLPLSYFTTGQRVPEDIETATPQRVANLVVREMKP